MAKIEFLFDFGSPNAYLCKKVLPEIEQRTGVRVERVPVLLGGLFKLTNNQSPVAAFGGVKNKLKFMAVETDRFIARHGITSYRFNPYFPVNTLMLMRGAVAAQKEGVFARYVTAGFHHMWEDPKKMDDPAVFKSAMASSGLDMETLIARSQDADVKAALMGNTQDAADRGAFGSPTFFVGDAMFFGKDQLRDVEDAILAQSARGN